MPAAAARCFVKVPAPTIHAGVGNALRQAYVIEGEPRSLAPFADLLAKLDRALD